MVLDRALDQRCDGQYYAFFARSKDFQYDLLHPIITILTQNQLGLIQGVVSLWSLRIPSELATGHPEPEVLQTLQAQFQPYTDPANVH